MTIRTALAALAGAALLSGCATTHQPTGAQEMQHPEGAIYDPSIDAGAEVDAALTRASESEKRVLIVMGANWCHDSRALASYLAEADLASYLDANFETVFIDVGLPQTGDGFNLDIAERFGVSPQGTPNVLMLNSEGELLDTPENAISWRNSASRSSAEVLQTLQGWVAQ